MRDASDALTEAEHEVYDRQIRVWGLDTQQRISKARVLVSFVNPRGVEHAEEESSSWTRPAVGLASETAKNVVLAGCGAVTLRDDDGERSWRDTFGKDGNFLNLDVAEDADANRTLVENMALTLAEMNPFGTVVGECAGASASGRFLSDESVDYFKKFDVVVAVGYDVASAEKINALCREAGCGFFGGFNGASSAWFFTDLGDAHEYVAASGKTSEGAATETVTFRSLARALRESDGNDWRTLPKRAPKLPLAFFVVAEHERRAGRRARREDEAMLNELRVELARAHGAKDDACPIEAVRAMCEPTMEIPAIAAIVGGVLAQEVLKAVTRRGVPSVNSFYFDVASGQGFVHDLGGTSDDQ